MLYIYKKQYVTVIGKYLLEFTPTKIIEKTYPEKKTA